MTWPEMLFYLTPKEDVSSTGKPYNDDTNRLIENYNRANDGAGRKRIPLHKLI